MSTLARICLILLVLASGAAHAQTASGPRGAPADSRTGLPQSGADVWADGAQGFAQCLQSWDAETNMSRQEFAAACRRLTNEDDKLAKAAKQKRR
jgi:hypothetical protein